MNIAIIASSKDPAGVNIRNNLIELYSFEKVDEKFDGNDIYESKASNKAITLYLTNNDLIFSENIDKTIYADIFIFASKHRSKENTPSFAVHSIGNWYKANFGGKEKTLCPSSPILLKNLFLSLIQNSHFSMKNTNFEVTLEATHHGPYIEKPAVFIEIGSTGKEWSNKFNGEIVAKTIMNILSKSISEKFDESQIFQNQNYESCVVLGGGHYNQSANKLMLRANYAVGHICPKYALEHLDEEMLMQAINKTVLRPNVIFLDWKGLGEQKQKIILLLEKLNLRYERVQNVFREKSI